MRALCLAALVVIAAASAFGQSAIGVTNGGSVGGGGSSAWGGITGALSAQADLQSALNLKAPLASPVFTGQPTIPDFTNGTHSHLNAAGGGNLTESAITGLVTDLGNKLGLHATADAATALAANGTNCGGNQKAGGVDAAGNAENCTDIAYANVTGTPVLPANTLGTASNWLRSYDPATGIFGKSQPSFADISGLLAHSQLPTLLSGDIPNNAANTSGTAAAWTTARNVAGNSVDGSANIAFANKFVVQGTADSGLSAAQFLGALATGIVKNTTATGILSIAVAGDFPTLNQPTTGNAATSSDGLSSASGTSPLTLNLSAKALTGSVAAASAGVAGVVPSTGLTGAMVAVGAITDDKTSLAVKPSCGVVATSNLTLSGLQTIDGNAGTDGVTIVLATGQTAGRENGPWIQHSGAWTRPTWYPSGGTTQAFQFITTFIGVGNTFSGTTWRITSAGAVTIDTTATTWQEAVLQINPSSVAGTIPAAVEPARTGDVTNAAASTVTTLATVNSNVGSFGGSTAIPVITTNAKGLTTAVTTAAVVAPAGTLTGTTLAANVTSGSLDAAALATGTLAAARMPAHTNDATSSAGSVALSVKQAHWTETAVTNASSPYTVLSADTVITCDATAGAVTINLPAAIGGGRQLTIKKIDSTANACTPTRAGADLIDGATTYALTVQYAASSIVDTAAAVWSRTHVNQLGGDLSGPSTNATVAKLNGNTPGGTCINQVVTSLSSSAVPTCSSVSTSNNGNFDLGMGGLAIEIANEGTTGTTTAKLAKLTGAPSTVILTGTGDTTGVVGICISGCGTTGNAVVARAGQGTCVFDGATTAGDYVQLSATVAGDCHDSGLQTYPTSGGQVLGRVLSTNVAGGSFAMTLHMGTQAASAAASAPFSDATGIVMNSSDNTKIFKVSASSITTGNTVTASPPIATGSFTFARQDAAQTFTGVQTFASSPTATVNASSERYGSGASVGGANFASAFGVGATASGQSCISIGQNASATNTNEIAIGTSSNAGSNSPSIAFGTSATTTAANQMVIGASGSGGRITDYYFGAGVTSTTASSSNLTINATGGSGTDSAGASAGIAGGKGTGAGAGGDAELRIALAGGAGASLNTISNKMRLSGASGHVEINGTAPALSSCGVTPSIVGNDNIMLVTIGTGVVTSCTVTFAKTWTNAPVCSPADATNILTVEPTTTTSVLTLTSTTSMSGDKVHVQCFGWY